MERPIIEIQNVSKLYRLGAIGFTTLREALHQWRARSRGASHPGPTAGLDPSQAGPEPNTFWAVRDLTASIHRGQIVGIIGRNGAGKSTILKILSRITDPTCGRAVLRGRVGSLLEVGAGFHPELSGLDNIFLNGAILGMKRSDITRQLDQIIEFADVGAFLHTPIKRYSSGMYVRLAFAVAAHLEPDILIVDEVLAVGDAQFQRKCLGKMQDISGAHGRTVIFVSHNLEAVQRLCSHCLLLELGRLVRFGPTDEVVREYLGTNSHSIAPSRWLDISECRRDAGKDARFVKVRYSSQMAQVGNQPYSDGPLEIELMIEARKAARVQSVAVGIRDSFGRKLLNADTGIFGKTIELPEGRTIIHLRIDALHLKPGTYQLALWLARYAGAHVTGADVLDYVEKAFDLEVVEFISSQERTSIGHTGVVTCAFKVLKVSAGHADLASSDKIAN